MGWQTDWLNMDVAWSIQTQSTFFYAPSPFVSDMLQADQSGVTYLRYVVTTSSCNSRLVEVVSL